MVTTTDADSNSDLTPRVIEGLGWIPDTPDFRDYPVTTRSLAPVPPDLTSFSLRDLGPEQPWHQGNLGSCVGQAIAYCVQLQRFVQVLPMYRPSRMFIYYNARWLEGTAQMNVGCAIRDGMRVVAKLGAPDENLWPYDETLYNVRPQREAYGKGLQDQVLVYQKCNRDLNILKQLIYNHIPIVFGFTVYESFYWPEIAETGIMQMPDETEQVYGAHATAWMGWDDTKGLETRNSWGPDWGDEGHFFMPYEYSQHEGLSNDFWVVRHLEEDTL